MKIRKGDTVSIISGKDRGKKGKVLQSFPKEEMVLVEGVNFIKKHLRPKKSGQKGQIINLPAPLHLAKVKLVCPKCGQSVRVGYKITEREKYRICKKCKQII